MSVAEEYMINSSGRVNARLEWWGCANSPRYHAYRFHTYRICPNKMDPDMAGHAKLSIQEYAQHNSAMRGGRGSQGIQYGIGQTSSTTTRSMFAECRSHLYQSWNKEVFSSLYQALFMCEMVNPSTSRSSQVACAAAIKKWQIKLQDRL